MTLPAVDASRLPDALRAGLRSPHTAALVLSHGMPIAILMTADRAQTLAEGRGLELSQFHAATAAENVGDMLPLVLRCRRYVTCLDAPAGRHPAALIPITLTDAVWPVRRNSASREGTTDTERTITHE